MNPQLFLKVPFYDKGTRDICLLSGEKHVGCSACIQNDKRCPGSELFSMTFPIILTDNGSEFHNPLSRESDVNMGEKLINIYFASPRRSDDKGKCEKNHKHFGEKIPKGYSMNTFTKHDIIFISN